MSYESLICKLDLICTINHLILKGNLGVYVCSFSLVDFVARG